MAESKVKVKTSDDQIVEVDLDVAKQWGPVNSMYEGMLIIPRKSIHYFRIGLKFLEQLTLMKILLH